MLLEVFYYSPVKRAVEAGATLIESTTVAGIRELGESIKVVTKRGDALPAEVVGADGVCSAVARPLSRRWEKRDLAIAAAALLSLREDADFEWNLCEIRFGTVGDGYCWVFPVNGAEKVSNVGCGTALKYSRLLPKAFRSSPEVSVLPNPT